LGRKWLTFSVRFTKVRLPNSNGRMNSVNWVFIDQNARPCRIVIEALSKLMAY